MRIMGRVSVLELGRLGLQVGTHTCWLHRLLSTYGANVWPEVPTPLSNRFCQEDVPRRLSRSQTLRLCSHMQINHLGHGIHLATICHKMDPLSITTACLTLLGTVGKTGLAVTEFIRGCREARADLTAISGELTQLHLVLDLLKDDAAVSDNSGRVIPESLQTQILSIIKNCTAVVDNINTVLQNYAGRTGVAKWVAFGKAEVAGLRMSLEAHRGSLSLVLELVSVSLSRVIADDVAVVRTDVHDIKQDTSQIPHIMAELTRLREIVATGQIPTATGGQNYVLQQYLDSLTSYAETVCNDTIEWDSDLGSTHTPSRKSSRGSLGGKHAQDDRDADSAPKEQHGDNQPARPPPASAESARGPSKGVGESHGSQGEDSVSHTSAAGLTNAELLETDDISSANTDQTSLFSPQVASSSNLSSDASSVPQETESSDVVTPLHYQEPRRYRLFDELRPRQDYYQQNSPLPAKVYTVQDSTSSKPDAVESVSSTKPTHPEPVSAPSAFSGDYDPFNFRAAPARYTHTPVQPTSESRVVVLSSNKPGARQADGAMPLAEAAATGPDGAIVKATVWSSVPVKAGPSLAHPPEPRTATDRAVVAAVVSPTVPAEEDPVGPKGAAVSQGSISSTGRAEIRRKLFIAGDGAVGKSTLLM